MAIQALVIARAALILRRISNRATRDRARELELLTSNTPGIEVNVSWDVRQLQRRYRGYERQIPFAASKALNKLAKDGALKAKNAAKSSLDRPRPSTIKAIRYKTTNKRELKSRVFILPKVYKFLEVQIRGGIKEPTASRYILVPTDNVRLDRYGNIPKGRVRRLIDQAKTFTRISSTQGESGIYKRSGSGANQRTELLIAFKRKQRYRRRFRYFATVKRHIKRNSTREMEAAIQQAISTAR